MKIQKSFQNDSSSLYLVATPIGNLNEFSQRSVDILNEVDFIFAEDTRTSKILLDKFSIKTHLQSYHMHNEKQSSEKILEYLKEGKNLALISDAGYPLISDPGQILVDLVVEHGFNVIPVSGSSAFLNALVASGLSAQPFTFYGFLENKDSQIRKQLEEVKDIKHTLIFYVSVHKLEKSLEILLEVLGNRKLTLAREITKLHEEFIRTDLKTLISEPLTLKGEFVLVIEGKAEEELSLANLLDEIHQEIDDGLSPSRAVSKISKKYNYSKNELYNAYQKTK